MEFGLFDHLDRGTAADSQTYKDRLRVIRSAEDAGFVGYHLAEHHMTPLGLAPSPSVFLSAVAQATRRIRLGPLVYLLPLYHPLQKPMPPLWAGVGSEEGMTFAARHGMNAIGLGPTPRIAGIVKRYRELWDIHATDPMRAFSSTASPRMGALRQIHVAPTDEQAWAEAGPAYQHWYDSLNWLWKEHGVTVSSNLAGDLKAGVANGAVIVGSPDTVRAAIAREKDATGYNYLVLQFAFGTLTVPQVEKSLDLFAGHVMGKV